MTQGPRRGWVRAAFTGLGVVLCTGLVGCMNTDKDKFPPKIGANTKQTGGSLPGTTRLPGQPGSGLGTTGQPSSMGTQPAGGFGSTTGHQPGAPNYGTTVPGGGLGSGAGVVPSMGPGVQPTSGSQFGGGLSQPNLTPSAPIGGGGYQNTPTVSSSPPAPDLSQPGPIPPGPPGAPGGYEVTPPAGSTRYGG